MTAEILTGPHDCTDVGNGERFAEQHGGKAKYIHAWKKWIIWNGKYWELDPSGEVERLAKQTASSIYIEASRFSDPKEARAYSDWAHGSQSRFRLSSMLAMAMSEQPIPCDYQTLDSDGWQLNCENGTVNLKTGKLDKHRPADFITMSTGVEYPSVGQVNAPLWLSFLEDIFEGNQDLIGFVQRLCGVALVGHIYEHILPIAIGTGCNGKSVLCETIRAVLGDYAMAAAQGILIAKRNQQHSTEVADLFRKRLVIVSETDDGAKLNEGLVKTLTGGEAIRARRMREDNWQFDPSHTILLVTNHRPVVKGTDHGIWRRLRIIPFNATIAAEKQDKQLTEKLRAEHPAILRWMVEGCLAWHRDGLQEPAEVMLATKEYKSDQDTLGVFVDDCCMVGAAYQIKCAALYDAYKIWATSEGETVGSNRKFKTRMVEKGFETRKNVTNWYQGITLNAE